MPGGERSEQIAEWVKLTEQKLVQVAPVSNKGGRGEEGGRGEDSFVPRWNKTYWRQARARKADQVKEQFVPLPAACPHARGRQDVINYTCQCNFALHGFLRPSLSVTPSQPIGCCDVT